MSEDYVTRGQIVFGSGSDRGLVGCVEARQG